MSCCIEVCPFMATFDAPQHIVINFEELIQNYYVFLSTRKCG